MKSQHVDYHHKRKGIDTGKNGRGKGSTNSTNNDGAGRAPLVERATEKPDTILVRVRVPGAARDFSPRVSFSYGVRTTYVCNGMQQHL